MAVLDRIPLDRADADARRVRPVRALLTLIAAVLYGVGWTAAQVFGLGCLVLAWSGAAVKLGWDENRRPGGG